MTFLEEDGLTATYLAANLRRPDVSTTSDQRPASERLAELQTLLQQGLISTEEYEEGRQRILDSI